MERDNLKKYNLISNYDNDSVIGYYEDLIIYYKNVAKDFIDKNIFEESINCIKIINTLRQAIDNDYIKEFDLIKVFYHDFLGHYDYKVYKEVKENETINN